MPASLHLYRATVIDTIDPEAAGRLRVTLPSTRHKKPAMLDLRVSGVVQCDTLIANSVIVASCTPDAGTSGE